jgi:hypothetical protein
MRRFVAFTLLLMVIAGLVNLTAVSAQPDAIPNEHLESSSLLTRAQAREELAILGKPGLIDPNASDN